MSGVRESFTMRGSMMQTQRYQHDRKIWQERVAREHIHRTHLPTSVGFIRNKEGKVLTVESAVNGHWGVVQGGIRRGEDPETGLRREMREEIRLYASEIERVEGPFLVRRLATPYRKGFTVGKVYFCFHVFCRGTPKLTLDPRAIRQFEWRSPCGAWWFQLFVNQPWYKKELLLEAFDIIEKG